MPVRTANAEWNGDLKSGGGTMALGSGAYTGEFSFASRMENAPKSNPEELLAAALAGCYSMALTADLGKAGFAPESVKSNAQAAFNNVNGAWTVESIDLDVTARVPNIDAAKFQEIANATKSACPVSRALTGVKINVNAKLA